MTKKELLERHQERMARLREDFRSIETPEIDQVQFRKIAYGKHTVELIYEEAFPSAHVDQITAQYKLAETMGIMPIRDTELHLLQCKSDIQLGGSVSAMPTDTAAEPLVATLMLNTVAAVEDPNYSIRKPRTQQQLQEIITHEMWHAIDLAGDHSMTLAGPEGGSLNEEPIWDDTQDQDRMTALAESNAHGALSVQELHRAVLDMSMARDKPYIAHPSETFVHECMSESAGIEPYTAEALSLSHSLEHTYVKYLITLGNDHGFKLNQIKGAMKRLMAMFTQQERLRNILAGLHTADYWKDL
jgi:hypothetical protein